MKNVIYYFSGTGNSFFAAKKLAEALPECEVISVASANPKMPDRETERIGFVYPTYGGGLPHKMAKFICDMDFTNIAVKDLYIFAVATFGAVPLNAVRDVPSLLRLKGFLLSYGACLHMPENYILMFDRPKHTEEILAESSERLLRISEKILKKERMKKIGKPIPLFRLFHLMFMSGVKRTAAKYRIEASCNGCGQCERLCPAGNISMKNGKPEFAFSCEACMACIQYCPQRAINAKRDLSHRKRYVHPEVLAAELMQQNK